MFCLRTLAGLTALGTVALGGCKSDRPTTDAASPPSTATHDPQVVTVTAGDFTFDSPDKIPAGVHTIRLVNGGKEFHQAQLIRLEGGKTAADLAKAMKNPGPPPSWAKFAGGPNGIGPGDEAVSTSALPPGKYVYLCLIPSPDGVIHAAKGMMRPFEVTGDSAAAVAELPSADLTIRLKDYDFQSSKPLTAGKHTILVENDGPQPHEVVLLKMAPGKKIEDFAAWAEGGLKGPPPAESLGGVAVVEKGGKGSFTAELTPGDYGMICFVPDMKDGKPHLAHGMMKNIKVS